ncbi:GATA transcription factor 15 [Linum grandiflorum]
MLDRSEKVLKVGDHGSRKSSPGGGGDSPQKKTCADCGTSKTPLWRGGPAGPKSLCNACGIRSRKKRRDVLGLTKSSSNDKKVKKAVSNHINGVGGGGGGVHDGSKSNHSKLRDGLKQRFMALGREVMMQRSTVEKQRRKLGEEEQAAVLLMALSYGSVYA